MKTGLQRAQPYGRDKVWEDETNKRYSEEKKKFRKSKELEYRVFGKYDSKAKNIF